jgi:hypothetical protein
MAEHSIYSPSTAARYLKCAASVKENEGREETTSIYAEEGTHAHAFGEMLLTTPVKMLDGFVEGFSKDRELIKVAGKIVPEDMMKHCYTYATTVNSLTEGCISRYVELKLDISDTIGQPDQFGTADCMAYMPDDELQIHDLKYGRTPVDAKDNAQLMIYALGGITYIENELLLDVSTVRLFIHQPRLNKVSEFKINTHDLLTFKTLAQNRVSRCEEIRQGAETKDSDYHAGEWCKYCVAVGRCEAERNLVYSSIVGEFEDMTEDNIKENIRCHTLTKPVDLHIVASDLKLLPFIEQWCKARKKFAMDILLSGEKIPNWKLVAGKRPPRKWADSEEMDKVLSGMKLKLDERYTKKLISPTQALAHEKIKGSPKKVNRLNTFIVQGDAAPTIVPADDKRAEWKPIASVDEFDELI